MTRDQKLEIKNQNQDKNSKMKFKYRAFYLDFDI